MSILSVTRKAGCSLLSKAAVLHTRAWVRVYMCVCHTLWVWGCLAAAIKLLRLRMCAAGL